MNTENHQSKMNVPEVRMDTDLDKGEPKEDNNVPADNSEDDINAHNGEKLNVQIIVQNEDGI
jgi:hypothetical protein